MHARDKYSGSICLFVSDEEKTFSNIDIRAAMLEARVRSAGSEMRIWIFHALMDKGLFANL
jgi:hypothetical protein